MAANVRNSSQTRGCKSFFVWIDCEMTGLDTAQDSLLEVACVVTEDTLVPVSLPELPTLCSEKQQQQQQQENKGCFYVSADAAFRAVIHASKETLDSMNPWCVQTHGASGLTQECLASVLSAGDVETLLCEFVSACIGDTPPSKVYLAGNSVHADRAFLLKYMPKLVSMMSYRIIDVSTIKILAQAWHPSRARKMPIKRSNHRALDDILGSINELLWYKKNVFVPQNKQDHRAQPDLFGFTTV